MICPICQEPIEANLCQTSAVTPEARYALACLLAAAHVRVCHPDADGPSLDGLLRMFSIANPRR